ncbi:MAG: cache and HAMP domain-containing protein, partial [Oscillospiraceae bacterium]|nr:cache and HAMP domain-containing protein [Oscillospiraceae bacterium]
MSYDRFGIRNQIVSMFLVVILPSVAASVFLLLSIRNVAKDKSLETALSNADGLGYWVSDITAAGDQCTDSIAKSKVISDFLADPPAERSGYIRFYLENPISKTISVPAQVKNIYIYTSGDDFVYNSTFLEITDEVRESKWYQRARAARGVSWDVLKDTSDGEYKLACTRPVMNGDEMTGLVVVLMSNDWVKNVNIESSVKLVFSADGKVFYSTYDPLIAGSDLTVYKEYDSETASVTYNGSLYGFRGYAVAKNMSYDRSSFQVALLLPEPYINYDTNRLTVIYAGYTGLMVVLSLLIILLFTNVFSSRVKTLSSKVHSVAGGNFNVNFEDSGRDEISQLYADISIMIENMQKLINDNYEAKLQSEAF